jgi:hypothetical protein
MSGIGGISWLVGNRVPNREASASEIRCSLCLLTVHMKNLFIDRKTYFFENERTE